MAAVSALVTRAGRIAGPGLLLTLLVIATLEISARNHLLPIFVPSPSVVAREITERPDLLFLNAGATALTATYGFAIAMLFACLAAALSFSIARVAGGIYKAGVVLQSIPLIALAPLLAVCMGTGTPLQIGIAALSSQFPILVGTMQGLKAVDQNQRELMHTLSASPLQLLRYVAFPMALPYIFAGLKIAAPAAVLGAITAEWTGADRGLGTMMLYALFSYDVAKVWLAVVATSALAAFGYAFWATIEMLTLRWERPTELAE